MHEAKVEAKRERQEAKLAAKQEKEQKQAEVAFAKREREQKQAAALLEGEAAQVQKGRRQAAAKLARVAQKAEAARTAEEAHKLARLNDARISFVCTAWTHWLLRLCSTLQT